MMDEPRLAGGEGAPVYRWLPARDSSEPSVILLHGRTGDESVMWVVAEALPSTGRMIAPRAPYRLPGGGYSWAEPRRAGQHSLMDYMPGVTALEGLLEKLEVEDGLDRDRVILVGFSQGAAVAFAATVVGRIRPQGIVALAAFVPDGDLSRLRGTPIFWGHGTRDTLVPIERARADIERLHLVGARVQFCEADVEHRVGVECMRGLKQWWPAHFGTGAARPLRA